MDKYTKDPNKDQLDMSDLFSGGNRRHQNSKHKSARYRRYRTKPLLQRWIEAGFDRRFVDNGLVTEYPDGRVWIDPILLNQMPGSGKVFNSVTGESLTYADERDNLPWDQMSEVFTDYDRAMIPTKCEKCGRTFISGLVLNRHKCAKMIETKIVPMEEGPMPDKPKQEKAEPLAESEQEWVVKVIRATQTGVSLEPERIKQSDGKVVARGAGMRVFSIILEHEGAAITTEQIVKESGLTKQQVHNAAHYLVQKGIVMRHAQGIYQATPDVMKLSERINVDVRYHNDVPPTVAERLAERLEPVVDDRAAVSSPPPLFPPPQPVAAPVVAPVGSSDIEDTIMVVLDMLRPEGFKAKDFAAVQAWIDATRQLLRVTES